MGDLWVHLRMKECCRTQLGLLDRARKLLHAQPSAGPIIELEPTLGELPIPEATSRIESERAVVRPTGLERRVYSTCAKLCTQHAAEHDGKGETEEAGFWRACVSVLERALAEGDALPTSLPKKTRMGLAQERANQGAQDFERGFGGAFGPEQDQMKYTKIAMDWAAAPLRRKPKSTAGQLGQIAYLITCPYVFAGFTLTGQAVDAATNLGRIVGIGGGDGS